MSFNGNNILNLIKNFSKTYIDIFKNIYQKFLNVNENTIKDFSGDERHIYLEFPCIHILNDITISFKIPLKEGTAIIEINNQEIITGYSISEDRTQINIDFSEFSAFDLYLLWHIKLSNNEEYYLIPYLKKDIITNHLIQFYDINGSTNIITFNSNIDIDYDINNTQPFINPYNFFGFNKYFLNCSPDTTYTISLNGINYEIPPQTYILIPENILSINKFNINDMDGDNENIYIVDIPENRNNIGVDVLGNNIIFIQNGSTILFSEGVIINTDLSEYSPM